ncbi:MAG: hypothetical protein U5J82_10825 [Desulfobacterales bacterium]|nr:hypothetical protein [Desulfobacterales bacterium]
MTNTTGRSFSRNSDWAPVLYAGYDSKGYRQGVMHNYCQDGMYFESDAPLPPQLDLYIKVRRQQPIDFEPEPCKNFRAKVKWCRQVAGGEVPLYGIGVQFTAKSHLAYGTNIPNSNRPCDFCEQRGAGRLFHQTETGLLLCPDCFHHMEALPNSIETALERFLLGNVV